MNGFTKRLFLVVLLCLPMAVYSGMSLRHDILRKIVVKADTLPATIDSWTGQELPLTEAELSMLDSPASCQRIYTDTAGDRVQVLVLQVNDSQNAHDPKLCMAGSGYRNPVDEVVPAPWAKPGQDSKISKAIFTKNDQNVTMYYWLQTSSGNITDMSGGFKVAAIFRALTGSSLHGIAVRVIGLENDSGSVTDPSTAAHLWSAISQRVDFNNLVSQLN
jgi:hypothetical protein